MTAPVAPVRLPPECLVEAAAVMGRAVADDPFFVYVLPDAEQRSLGVPMMMEMFLRIGLAHGEVWVTPPPIRGVACWLSPMHPSITAEDRNAAGLSGVRSAWGREAVDRYQAFVGAGMAPWARLLRSRTGISRGLASSRGSKARASGAPSCAS